MNFKLYMELFGSFSYSVPEDKFLQMFDFYMLSFLFGRSQYDKYKLKSSLLNPDGMDEEDQQDYMLQEVADKLLPTLKEEMLDALFFAMSSEMQHSNIFTEIIPDNLKNHVKSFVDDYRDTYNKLYDNLLDYEFGKRKEAINIIPDNLRKTINNFGYLLRVSDDNALSKIASFITMKNRAEIQGDLNIVKLMHRIFSDIKWKRDYGGKMWANIAEGWIRLHSAKTQPELIIAIDHVYDLQHNTNSIFDKIPAYAQDGNHDWIKKALNYKANISSPYELLNMVSPSMKKLATRMLKSKMGTTQQQDFEAYYSSKRIVMRYILFHENFMVAEFTSMDQAVKKAESIIGKKVTWKTNKVISKYYDYNKQKWINYPMKVREAFFDGVKTFYSIKEMVKVIEK